MFVEIADDVRRVRVERVITCRCYATNVLVRLPHLVRSLSGLKNIIPVVR
jgi:hypothetical protein